MSHRNVIIKLTPEKIYFNEDISVALEKSNLPPHLKSMNFDCAFWVLNQSAFDREKGILTAEVADYFPRQQEIEFFAKQNPKYTINELRLSNLRDPNMVTEAVRYYQKQVLRLFREQDEEYDLSNEIQGHPSLNQNLRQYEIKRQFEVYFKNAVFRTGCIAFEKFIEEIGKPVVFHVYNENLLAEYEYIKSYFPKALKIKKFKVDVVLKVTGDEVIDASAISSQIDLIDHHLIDSIKISRTLALPKMAFSQKPDKSLFTSDEIFDALETGDVEGNIFKQGEQDILAFLIDVKKVRNRKQLEYLAGKKQSDKEKIRFTLNPHFGFLFLVPGQSMNHFCWELLNSHATYIWSIENKGMSIEMQYRRVEMVINTIRNVGREMYKNSYRNIHLNEDLVFYSINHKDVNSDFIDGFVQWKHKLDEKIV